jgi:hypothetical protein
VRNEILHERVELTRQALRQQLEQHFHPELSALPASDRREVLAAADVLLQFESLDHFRLHRAFSRRDTAEVLHTALTRLLR